MVAGHLVGVFGLALVEELAGDQAPLGPPFVAVDQHFRVARRLGHDLGGLEYFFLRRR